MIDKDLATRLKSYRNFKHLTQKEVAKYLKVPHSAISDIENGKRDITVGELKIFSNLYGRSVEEIMSGKKYDYYNIANIARLLTELPDEDLKEVMFIIEYKRKRNEEGENRTKYLALFYFRLMCQARYKFKDNM